MENNDIILRDQPDFEPEHIFDCGQCFRFNRNADGSYTGTAFGRTTRISKTGGDIILHDTSPEDFIKIWRGYLDLDYDYGDAKKRLTAGGDKIMKEATRYGAGIRILNQELWETIISFIISASNNIPRIKKIIEALCTNFGEPHEYCGKTHYAFPTPKRLANETPESLSIIRAGFRDKYILSCARAVAGGSLDLEGIRAMPSPDAKRALMNIQGIGNKVSDCILLFGLGRRDAYPIDVWIKRVTEYCWFGGEQQSVKTLAEFAESRFGDIGGIAQQYLFFYARAKKTGTNKT
ncbi:MAG: DNA-3-methyladenine glycosylase 2 family protein [Clostridia bacterium]|nr:DNA-3-methyladenine glycosylase 2 family protein [Clostridia bacterium]